MSLRQFYERGGADGLQVKQAEWSQCRLAFWNWFSFLRVKACQGWSFPPLSHAAGSVLRSLTKFHLCWLPPPPPHLANPLIALPTESQPAWFPSAFGALFLEVSVTGKQHWIDISNSSISHHMTGLIRSGLFPVCPPNPTESVGTNFEESQPVHLDSRHRDNDILILDLSLNVSTLMEIRLYQSSTEMLQAEFTSH